VALIRCWKPCFDTDGPAERKSDVPPRRGRRVPGSALSTTSSRRIRAGDRAPGRGTWRQFRYSGLAGSRSYRVYVPFGLRRTTRAPLLLALHGCAHNTLEFATSTRFNQLADQHGFVVVYPEQPPSHNPQRCWNWFRPAHQFRLQGEPAILAGIVRLVAAETTTWRIDPSRM